MSDAKQYYFYPLSLALKSYAGVKMKSMSETAVRTVTYTEFIMIIEANIIPEAQCCTPEKFGQDNAWFAGSLMQYFAQA
ncbi:hypothetical protein KXR87_01025 [Yokenella regensburgei]|uniref:hypothetical protein n=1 Tax=Yokenella regensburgei TaxID=158877 RepID=UPI003F165BBB